MKKNKNLKAFLGITLGLVAINIAGNYAFKRFDLTADHRYTLSETTKNILKKVKDPLFIDVYLEGDFPAEFRRLQTESKQLLEEFQSYNSNVNFIFVNPLEDEKNATQMAQQLFANGMKPISVTVNDKGKQSQEMVFPWAVATSGTKHAKIQLLKNVSAGSTEEKVSVSVQHLEYAVAEAIYKVSTEKSKKVAIIKGIGEPNDIYIADFLRSLRDSYYIAPFTLDSVAVNPQKTLKDLQEYDLAIITKPTKTFDENQIQVLDQFVMNGGKSIWMLDQVQADMDSLYNKTGEMLAYPKDYSLGEMLFKYGVRVNPDLVKDEMGSPIKLAVGQQGSETVYETFNWKFAPYAVIQSNHPMVKNIEGVKFDFANSIDVLNNNIKKTVLLASSPYASKVGTPSVVSLAKTVNDQVDPKTAKLSQPIPLAVLLEGSFTSVFKNRIVPFKSEGYLNEGKPTKMIVISDGDIAKNQLDQNKEPMELGYDKWTNTLYGNKEFLLNAVNYLLDDNGLINLRTKEVKLPLLNKEKVYANYDKIRIIVVVLPLIVLAVFGFIFTYLRKKKYTK
ncbi:gliding motility-associated ABC transporter substrate-binding protein GldG [Flavobacterium sp. xlx-214]|uniref:gliding motility-associated ABC transporter substrate-binding protein GldG n=1 Tax=unclassified Flavobacterium TaxID=196869 RepID=UPI0013D1B622|nr:MULTISPECIES: gliding motility-associated ABC transporter substrate-binding protein GldG [unclassified Flavobacterium]MBA5791425.1 gliding motility-associated ABC transporter substrate-binding protein GldG [Flavobacterium sp. xlx-221]QMI83424.1 gliding motility-associated ABC transporter substrate-binding protein GldG [Flavobacterium sp. xlx-214]